MKIEHVCVLEERFWSFNIHENTLKLPVAGSCYAIECFLSILLWSCLGVLGSF